MWTRPKLRQAVRYLQKRWSLGEIGHELGESVDDVAIACYGDGDSLVARDHQGDGVRAEARSNTVVLQVPGLASLSDETRERLVHLAQLAADQFLSTLMGSDETESEAPDVTHLLGTARQIDGLPFAAYNDATGSPQADFDVVCAAEGLKPGEIESDPWVESIKFPGVISPKQAKRLAKRNQREKATPDPEAADAAIATDGEPNERPEQPDSSARAENGGQPIGRSDQEQHNAASVPDAERGREGADAGDQGQGAGVPGPDREDATIAGDGAGEDEPRAGRHVGGEVDHQVELAQIPVRSGVSAADPLRSETAPPKDAGPAAPEPAAGVTMPAAIALFRLRRRSSGEWLHKSGTGFTDQIDRAYRGNAERLGAVYEGRPWLRVECAEEPVT